MKAYVFPGQGAQFPGMGKEIFDTSEQAKKLFNKDSNLDLNKKSHILLTAI